jgi:RNA polymerase sigma factor (sigma-70 family)
MSPRFSIRPLATLADRRLAELAAGGDERAFEALIGRHRVALERYCWRLGLPDHRAEDVLQQAFTRAWVSLRRGDEVGQPRAWLYRIVHNAALNSHRSARLRTHESIDAPVLGSLALATTDDVDTRLRVLDTLRDVAALPHLQRKAVVMTAIQGRTHEETANELGLTDGAVRGLLHRARTKLRAAAAALTPQGLAELLARMSSGGAEAGAGAAGAGLAGVLGKGAAVSAVAGLLAGGAVTQLEHNRSDAHRTSGGSVPRAAVAAAREPAPSLRLGAGAEHLGGDVHGVTRPRSGERPDGGNTSGGGSRDRSSGGHDRGEGLSSGGGERAVAHGENGGQLSRSGSDRSGSGSNTSRGADGGRPSVSGSDGSRLDGSGSEGFAISDGRTAGERSGGSGTSGGDTSGGGSTSNRDEASGAATTATATVPASQGGHAATDGGGSAGSTDGG